MRSLSRNYLQMVAVRHASTPVAMTQNKPWILPRLLVWLQDLQVWFCMSAPQILQFLAPWFHIIRYLLLSVAPGVGHLQIQTHLTHIGKEWLPRVKLFLRPLGII